MLFDMHTQHQDTLPDRGLMHWPDHSCSGSYPSRTASARRHCQNCQETIMVQNLMNIVHIRNIFSYDIFIHDYANTVIVKSVTFARK